MLLSVIDADNDDGALISKTHLRQHASAVDANGFDVGESQTVERWKQSGFWSLSQGSSRIAGPLARDRHI
jgi:hypothetical protein